MAKKYYEYNGLSMTLPQWAKHLGISYGSMLNRVKNHYPDRLDKMFSSYYLTPGANMPNETMVQAQERVEKSLKHQSQYMRQLDRQKWLKEQIQSNSIAMQNNLKEWSDL